MSALQKFPSHPQSKKEAVFFTILHILLFRGNPFVDLDAFNHCLYICYAVNQQQSNILDIQRAETFRDKTSIIQRQCNMKVTAVASWKCLTGLVHF